jgi:hypothetical protein
LLAVCPGTRERQSTEIVKKQPMKVMLTSRVCKQLATSIVFLVTEEAIEQQGEIAL